MTRIACSIPLDGSGKRTGYLAVPYSDDAHAYGVIPVPIAVISGGDGPTVLLSAGVHGDEYEGQVLLRRLVHTLEPPALRGRLIILPSLNLPAARAARRTSPIDAANMNRAFPGDPDGGPTAQLAFYVESELLPRCQAALDLHSGGTASEYLPCAYVYAGGGQAAAKASLANAFGALIAVVVGTTAETRSLSAACERAKVSMIATELGGGASIGSNAYRVATDGTYGVLRHLGVLPGELADETRSTQFVRIPDHSHFLTSPTSGLFEPKVGLGEQVEEGSLAGWLHEVEDIAIAPREVRFARSGMVVARRVPTLTRRGDYLFTTAIPTEEL
jgi:uncharacterized protein